MKNQLKKAFVWLHSKNLFPRTFRAQLLLLLALFWLVPMTAIYAYASVTYRQDVASTLLSTVSSRLHYAALLANEKLSSAVDASRALSYESSLEDFSKQLSDISGSVDALNQDENRDADELAALLSQKDAICQKISLYLQDQFQQNENFSLTVLQLDAAPGQVFSAQPVGYNTYGYYMTFVHSQIGTLRSELGNRVGFVTSGDRLYLIRALRKADNSGELGVLVLQLNNETAFSFLTETVADASLIIQVNQEVLPLSGRDEEDLPLILPEDRGIEEGVSAVLFTGYFDGRDYDLAYRVSMPNRMIYGGFQSNTRLLVLLLITSIPLFVLLFWILRKRFTRPLESLSNAAWALKAGELGVHAQAPRDDELGQLVSSFNAMSDQMQNLFNRVYKEQLALRDARIMALQSQINPHFFNNTLELMNWKARMLGDEQLSDMIQALSTLLDSAMDRSNTRFIPLRQELAVADAYLIIISARFGQRMQLIRDVDEGRLDAPVPRMLLQPLLENAVVHGLEPAGGGQLILQISSRGAELMVDIINDGTPLSAADEARIAELLDKPIDPADPRSQRLGIRNVHERLRLIYGERSGLTFHVDELARTHCRFRLPPPPEVKEP